MDKQIGIIVDEIKKNYLSSEICCLVPITNPSSINQIKNACLLYDKVSLLFRTRKYQAKRQRFPLLDTDTKKLPIKWSDLSNNEEYNQALQELEYLDDKGILNISREDPDDFDILEDFKTTNPIWTYSTVNYKSSWQNDNDIFCIEDLQYIDIPIYSSMDSLKWSLSDKQEQQNRNQVLEVIFANMPSLSEETPWEEILDWRNDKDAQIKLRRLKCWANTVAQQGNNVNPNYLKDEIRCLLDDYEQYMKVNKMKYSYSVMHSIFTTTGEILEDIVKFRLKDLFDIPFKMQERNLALQEAELVAPGRELAYIVATQEKFN